MSGKQRPTAEELRKELASDPGYVERRRAVEMQAQRHAEGYSEAAAPILQELEDLGFPVQRVIELGDDGRSYRPAVPVLIRGLAVVEHRKVLNEIIRALTDPVAKPQAAEALLAFYEKLTPEEELGLKWTTANALSVVADHGVLDSVERLIREPAHGRAREQLVTSLANMRGPRAVTLAEDALDDPDLTGHALEVLGVMRSSSSRRLVEPFLTHSDAPLRREAKKALKRIDRAN